MGVAVTLAVMPSDEPSMAVGWAWDGVVWSLPRSWLTVVAAVVLLAYGHARSPIAVSAAPG